MEISTLTESSEIEQPDPALKELQGREKVVYGGLGLLISFVIYIPLQDRIDARLRLSSIPIPGLAVVNVLLLLSLLRVQRTNKEESETEPVSARFAFATAVFFIFSFISLVYGTLRTSGAYFVPDFVLWKRWTSMLLVFWFARRFIHSEKQVKRLLWIMTFVLIFASENLLKENLTTGMASSAFREGLRFGGVFGLGGVNDLGAFFSEFIFIPLCLFFIEEGFLKKIFLLGCAVLIGMGSIFTYSRGAWVGMVIGLIAYFCRRSKTGLIWVVLIGALSFPLLPASVVSRWDMTKESGTGELEPSAEMRIDVWNEGMRLIREYPLTGVGWNRFRSEVRLKEFNEMHLEPHNLYIKVAAEMGIPALAWFIFFLFTALRLSGNTVPGFHREFACAFTGFWFAFVPINFFGNRILREPMICYFMIMCGIMVWFRIENFKKTRLPAVSV